MAQYRQSAHRFCDCRLPRNHTANLRGRKGERERREEGKNKDKGYKGGEEDEEEGEGKGNKVVGAGRNG
jgi:hypothetical protein